jgi:hypothetical protein
VREYHPTSRRSCGSQAPCVARAYGFPSWPKLRAHLEVVERYSRNPHRAPPADPVDEFSASRR